MTTNCLGDLFLGLGQLALALVGFLALMRVIEWPEKAIRWLVRRFRRTPPAPPRQHDDFDDVV